MTERVKQRWQRDRDDELERYYEMYEKIADAFVARCDNKTVQEMERRRGECEGDKEAMRYLVRQYSAVLLSQDQAAVK